MNTRSVTRIAIATAATGAAVVLGTGTANADDWPVQQPDSPISVDEVRGFLTPSDPDYWNPLVNRMRVTSPYGNTTRVVCTSFHGVTMSCFQADRDGNAHQLIRLQANFPNVTGSSAPGGGVGHYVFPGYIPGIG